MRNKLASTSMATSLTLVLMVSAFATISPASNHRTTTTTISSSTTTSTGTGFAEAFSLQNGVAVNDVQQAFDGGFVVTGFGGTYPSYLSTGLVIKLSSVGAVQWQNNYGPLGIDPSIQQTTDGGYVVTSGEGNTDGFASWSDLTALKLDSNGGIQWQRQYQDP